MFGWNKKEAPKALAGMGGVGRGLIGGGSGGYDATGVQK